MKSRICCAFMIAMLLVSAVAFGEIVSDSYWNGDSYGMGTVDGDSGGSYLTGEADGDDNFGWGYGEGWEYYATTVEQDDINWEYYIKVWAEADLWLWSGQTCSAYAYAEASGNSPFYPEDTLSAEALVQGAGEGGKHLSDWDSGAEPGGIYKHGTSDFGINQGVNTKHEGVALVSVPYGAHNRGTSVADIRAWCDMWL